MIRTIFTKLRYIYFIAWSLMLCVVVCFEWTDMGVGIWSDDERTIYLMQVVCVLISIAVIPLSMKVYQLRLIRWREEALTRTDRAKRYLSINVWRLLSLFAVMLADWVAYYLSMHLTPLLCAGMVAAALLLCMPQRKVVFSEWDKVAAVHPESDANSRQEEGR